MIVATITGVAGPLGLADTDGLGVAVSGATDSFFTDSAGLGRSVGASFSVGFSVCSGTSENTAPFGKGCSTDSGFAAALSAGFSADCDSIGLL